MVSLTLRPQVDAAARPGARLSALHRSGAGRPAPWTHTRSSRVLKGYTHTGGVTVSTCLVSVE